MLEQPSSTPARPWRLIAEQASREFDSGKLADLVRELNRALDEQGVLRPDGPTPEKKSA